MVAVAAIMTDFAHVLTSVTGAQPAAGAQPMAAIADRVNTYGKITADWLGANGLDLMIGAAAGLVIYALLRMVKRRAAAIARASDAPHSLHAIMLRTLGKSSRFFRLMLSLQIVNIIANAPAPLARAILTLFTIAAVIQAAIWLREIIIGLLERRVSEGDAHNEALVSGMILIRLLVTILLFAIAGIVLLDNLGFNITGLIAGLGVGGIAIGLAAQGIFSDLFAAIAIILDRPFAVGDMIGYDASTATVEKIGMKSTRLRSVTGEMLVISNTKLLDMQITNMSKSDYRRTRFSIGVVYQTAPDKARAIPAMLQAIVAAQGANFIRAGFVGFGDSALDFDVFFDVISEDYEEIFAVRHRIGIAILESFKNAGYEFAYPTQTTFTAAPDGMMVMPYAGVPAGNPPKRNVRVKK